MKKIRLLLFAFLCASLLSACFVRTKVEGHSSATLPADWEIKVKESLAGLSPLGSPADIHPTGTPEPCTIAFENRLYGYCGKVNVDGGLARDYFISSSNVVWLVTLNGLSTPPQP